MPEPALSFSLTSTNAPGATETLSRARNNRGKGAGNADSNGFIYKNGTFTTLTAPGATSTVAEAINHGGEVGQDF
jgi:hypothetical protein